jgi:large subunit ribosomal protein L24
MSAAKIKKGDKVVVLSGKDKGKTGEVARVLTKDAKVVVNGVNIAVRHRKPDQANPQGGLERREAPLHVSNVAIVDPKDGKATRVRFDVAKDGKKVRVSARTGEKIDG